MFDSSKSGKIEKEKVRTILNTLGHTYDDGELDELLEAEDTEGKFFKQSFKRLLLNSTYLSCLRPINSSLTAHSHIVCERKC